MIEIADIRPVDELCKKSGVSRLYLFGSALTNKFTDKSDVDFYVIFHEYSPLKLSVVRSLLSKVINRNVDLHVQLPQKRRKENRMTGEIPARLIFDSSQGSLGNVISSEIIDNPIGYSEMLMSNEKALVTVALPVWGGKDICWLSMESICRQHSYPFELIVFEEQQEGQLGREWFFGWQKSLKLAGCTRVIYLTSAKRFALSEKWCIISRYADSVAFCLCGCDDYYSEDMVKDAYEGISAGYEYCYDTKGYFYSIPLKKVIMYDLDCFKGLMQSVPTAKMKAIKIGKRAVGVDRWIYDRIDPARTLKRTEIRDILCTDGYNTISLNRMDFYTHIEPPFEETDKTIFDILPEEVAKKLAEMR